MVTMLQWISPPQHQLCIQRGSRSTDQLFVESLFGPNQLPHSSAQSAAKSPFQIKPVTGRFPQSETRPNLTVTRHLEALVVVAEAVEGLAPGSVGSIGCSLTRVGGCYAHPWPRGGTHTAP